ncbi:hypothetical protein Pla52o_20510 [Novipirellula galeiformis]|uniref:Uncharacterized protein n=1 Tax=Novipirellula galeiformis TaxID=2528004 RepID=A0A5C6CKN9_9BACT|nr:hypothetical protein Pla52o_20510 [Novipirellula galeiformis]
MELNRNGFRTTKYPYRNLKATFAPDVPVRLRRGKFVAEMQASRRFAEKLGWAASATPH